MCLVKIIFNSLLMSFKSSRGGLVRKGVSFSFSKFCTFCEWWIESGLGMIYRSLRSGNTLSQIKLQGAGAAMPLRYICLASLGQELSYFILKIHFRICQNLPLNVDKGVKDHHQYVILLSTKIRTAQTSKRGHTIPAYLYLRV